MADASAEEILSEIEELKSFFESCRAHFARLTDDHIGLTHIPPVPHYVLQGLESSFSLLHVLRKMTSKEITKLLIGLTKTL